MPLRNVHTRGLGACAAALLLLGLAAGPAALRQRGAALLNAWVARAAEPAPAAWTLRDGVVTVHDPAFRARWMYDQAFLRAIAASPDPTAQAAKQVWVDFEVALGRALLEHRFNAAVDGILARYVAPDYRQHDPNIPDGRAGLAAWLKAGGKHRRPNGAADAGPPVPIALIAEGGMVSAMLQAVSTAPAAAGSAPGYELSLSIFRVADGKLAEHWEAAQAGAWWCRIGCGKARGLPQPTPSR